MGNKEKTNRKYRVWLNTQGFKYLPGLYYFKYSIPSVAIKNIFIKVLLIIMLIANCIENNIDTKGSFYLAALKREKNNYKIPQRFKRNVSKDKIIKLLVSIKRLKQVAKAFYKELIVAAQYMKIEISKINSCIFFK